MQPKKTARNERSEFILSVLMCTEWLQFFFYSAIRVYGNVRKAELGTLNLPITGEYIVLIRKSWN